MLLDKLEDKKKKVTPDKQQMQTARRKSIIYMQINALNLKEDAERLPTVCLHFLQKSLAA